MREYIDAPFTVFIPSDDLQTEDLRLLVKQFNLSKDRHRFVKMVRKDAKGYTTYQYQIVQVDQNGIPEAKGVTFRPTQPAENVDDVQDKNTGASSSNIDKRIKKPSSQRPRAFTRAKKSRTKPPVAMQTKIHKENIILQKKDQRETDKLKPKDKMSPNQMFTVKKQSSESETFQSASRPSSAAKVVNVDDEEARRTNFSDIREFLPASHANYSDMNSNQNTFYVPELDQAVISNEENSGSRQNLAFATPHGWSFGKNCILDESFNSNSNAQLVVQDNIPEEVEPAAYLSTTPPAAERTLATQMYSFKEFAREQIDAMSKIFNIKQSILCDMWIQTKSLTALRKRLAMNYLLDASDPRVQN